MTNFNIDLTPILTAIIALIGAIITYYVIPVLKGKISAEQWNEVAKWVKIAVAAAEQMKEAGIITMPKKDYVLSFLKDKGVTITDSELDALIEAAVFEINKAKNLLEKDLSLQEVIQNE
ncbi:MAG: phage holin, LLH family [Sedimentibacter sp.]